MRLGSSVSFLPDEAMILLPVALGLMVILGLLPASRAVSVVVMLAAVGALMPILGESLGMLPLWVLLLLMGWFGIRWFAAWQGFFWVKMWLIT